MSAYQLGQVTRKQVKGKDLIECNVKGDEGIVKVTIWKTDKDGRVFPNFDNLKAGDVIEGNLWTKPGTENVTLYPPKEKKAMAVQAKALMAEKTQNIARFQETKSQSIERAQERNEIMYAKKSAVELIAHHPAYTDAIADDVPQLFKTLTRMILNFNPLEDQLTPDFKQETQVEVDLNNIPF